jgi:putative ABC transport system permease protein
MKFIKRFFKVGENTKMALQTVREHKMRSILTVLGVVIAVIVLIMVFSIMYGLDKDMRAFLEDYGTNTLFIEKLEPGIHIGRLSPEERMRKPLTLEDAEAIKAECPDVKYAVAEVVPWDFTPGPPKFVPTAKYNGKEVYNIEFSGATPDYEAVYNTRMAQGRFFTDSENEHRADVAVVGYDLADTFWPGGDAIGQEFQVGGMSFLIVGVQEKRKGTFLRDSNADLTVLIPYNTYHKHRPQDKEHSLGAQAFPGKKSVAEDEIRGLLRRRRGDAYNKPDSFGISSAEQVADQFRSMMSAIALVTVVVASIGLLVGGVGVMNIMLMSVTERTHEIGVRKAIGARRGDVIRQFLIEAIVLTGMGGVVGVLISVFFIILLNIFAPKVPSAVPAWAIGVAVGAAMSVGLFFGIYPAVKAARLDPVEALRYE